MVTFAIDRIPSLADAMPYALLTVLWGDESDGVPEPLDDGYTSPQLPRFLPRGSVSLAETDQTKRMRKP